MTTTANTSNTTSAADEKPPVPEGYVRLTIDDIEVTAPKGEMVIRTCERMGIEIPRFCDHPLLEPIAACRQCLVEVEMRGRKMPKPQPSCATAVADGMVVNTQLTSGIALRAQDANLEFLLVNHPLDCPMCDKGGECPLQNQTLSHGPGESRFRDAKKVFVKPIPISTEILLDRDRCVQCYRCTRFSEQIAGDPFIDMAARGTAMQVATGPDVPFQSYFSGNTIQICPVGALTSTAYRFRSRPFDMVSSPTICELCAAGCELRTDHRSGKILRRLAGDDPEVNEEWNCDKGRFAFNYVTADDRIRTPLVRGEDGELAEASWTEAMTVAAAGLTDARRSGGVGVLAGGRLSVTDAYAYAKFARMALRTNDIDFRARDHSAEEMDFLSRRVVGTSPASGAVTYRAVEGAPTVLLVALEPEEECPILFLRLRKASRSGTAITSIAPLATRGLEKMGGTLLSTAPGAEVPVVQRIAAGAKDDPVAPTGTALRQPGAVILVGERAAQVPGLLTAVGELADATGAGLAWVPRRAGERGALDVGATPTLLPGGRPVADAAARAEVESAWGLSTGALPAVPGRDTTGILTAAAAGELGGLLIGGVELEDLPDPAAAREAVRAAGFVVSLELRRSEVTEMADVVFPVAAAPEKSGAYVDWEGRTRPFATALTMAGGLDDARVLDTLGVEMDVDLYTQTPKAASADLSRLGPTAPGRGDTAAPAPPSDASASAAGSAGAAESTEARGSTEATGSTGATESSTGELRLASWRELLDGSRAEEGEPNLAGTRRPITARVSRATGSRIGVADGQLVTVSGPAGALTVPVTLSEMCDDAVWVPARVGQRASAARLGAAVGQPVQVAPAAAGSESDVPPVADDPQGRLGDHVEGLGGAR